MQKTFGDAAFSHHTLRHCYSLPDNLREVENNDIFKHGQISLYSGIYVVSNYFFFSGVMVLFYCSINFQNHFITLFLYCVIFSIFLGVHWTPSPFFPFCVFVSHF